MFRQGQIRDGPLNGEIFEPEETATLSVSSRERALFHGPKFLSLQSHPTLLFLSEKFLVTMSHTC